MGQQPVESNKFYGLDHLRALAIILVFLFHYQVRIFGHPEWVADAGKFGWSGVDLFFVLSGFLIASQLFAKMKETGSFSLKEFFLKRFFRIMPAFWLVLAIYFCWEGFHEREQLRPLWRYVFFLQNFGLDVMNFGTFSHAWSLCVEEHFYLFLPFILLLLSLLRIFKGAWWLLLVLFAGTMLARYYSFTHIVETATEAERPGVLWYMFVYYPSYCRLDGLLIGVGIAAMYTFRPVSWQKVTQYGNWFFLLSLAVLTGGYFLCYDEHSFYASVFGFSVVSVGYGLLMLSALSPTCFLYKWKSRVTTFIAMISYGVYLSHKGVAHIVQVLLEGNGVDINSNLCMVVCVVACVIAAVLLYYIIERPFMRLRKRIV